MTDTTSRLSRIWEDYQNALCYQASLKLNKTFSRCVDFYEGRQWPAPTEKTKNLPRPVINFVKMICRNKKSAILATTVRLLYSAYLSGEGGERFNAFAAYLFSDMRQESIDKLAIDDAVKKGTYVFHYFWDSEARGKHGNRDGGLACELIDPLNIFFSNPTERDEQKQAWIIISSRESVASVRAKADKGIDQSLIVEDEAGERPYGEREQDGEKLCTVLTRYFRKGGEVYCEKVTRSAVVRNPFPLAPDLEGAYRELGFESEDAPNNSLPDDDVGKELRPKGVRAPLYPIVVGNYEPREKSIFGLGEVEGLIPNQKAVNFHFAMSLLNTQEMAWGKYVVKPGALKGQKITNSPGQVLTDYTGTGDGIKKMSEQPLNGKAEQLADMLITLTRNVSGANEVMSGEVLKASMSGAAIAQLQAQASQPIDDLRDTFWKVKEKQGLVVMQFMKLFYSKQTFSYKRTVPKTDATGAPVLDTLGRPLEEEVELEDTFNSAEYADAEFSVTVEAVRGTKASAAGDIQMLETLFMQGKITLKTFISLYPDDALSNKSEILKAIEADEASEIAELRRQLEAANATIAQYEAALKEQQKTVDNVTGIIQECNSAKSLLAELYVEAKRKIETANANIRQTGAALEEATRDATDFAIELAKSGRYNPPPAAPT